MAALLAVIALAGVFRARDVTILADGNATTVASRSANDSAIVMQAGIDLAPGDSIEAAGDNALIVRRATDVLLTVDGRTFDVRTQAVTIAELLVDAGVSLAVDDSVHRNRVFVSPEAPIVPPPTLVARAGSLRPDGEDESDRAAQVSLDVRRAMPFAIVENGQELLLRSSRETVATALRDVGVRLGPGDRVQPPLDTELSTGLQIHVDHAAQIIVTLPEAKISLYTLSDDVGGALEASGITLPTDFRISPTSDTRIVRGMEIRVIGISEEQEQDTERIAHQTLYRPDANLAYGDRRVEQGQDGVQHRRYRVTYENGIAVTRELEAEWLDPQPVDTVIYYSTAVPRATAPLPADRPDESEILRTINVYATWYNPASAGRSPSDPSYGITATGVPVIRGVVATDPSVIPLGTRLFVPGYGYAVAGDTGGGIRGNMIDLGYPDGVQVDWRSQWVDIFILG